MKKLTKIGIVLLAISIISLFIQSAWYGYVDENGILHDSLFLPIGVFAFIGAVAIFLISMILFVLGKFLNKNNRLRGRHSKSK